VKEKECDPLIHAATSLMLLLTGIATSSGAKRRGFSERKRGIHGNVEYPFVSYSTTSAVKFVACLVSFCDRCMMYNTRPCGTSEVKWKNGDDTHLSENCGRRGNECGCQGLGPAFGSWKQGD
jgi:hypothetical protein